MKPLNSSNHVALSGTVTSPAVLSHRMGKLCFYVMSVDSPRMSGQNDTINVLVEEETLGRCPSLSGAVLIEGEVRSFNNRSGKGSKLVISVLAKEIVPHEGSPQNEVTLKGTICKQPIYRKTPLGREICDILLAVGRRYGRADYLPCIAWGANARLAETLAVGEQIGLTGRIQSRKYIKLEQGVESEKTAFEISVFELERLEPEP